MDEIWKPIPGYEGYYEASTLGRIRGVDRTCICRWGCEQAVKGKILKPRVVKNGYQHVKFTVNGIGKEPLVHRLIALTFVPNPNNLPQVNHKDGNKTNNTPDNLEWCTASENILHMYYVLKCGGKRKKPVICLDTGEIFESSADAGRKLGINGGGIFGVCQGKAKTAHGLRFAFVKGGS